MIVYRIEHPANGVEPYNNKLADCSLDMRDEHCDKYHPGKRDEFPEQWLDDSYYCAFTSIELLRRWFEGWLADLADRGFVVAEYRVNDTDVLVATYQCIFVKANAAKIRQYSPLDTEKYHATMSTGQANTTKVRNAMWYGKYVDGAFVITYGSGKGYRAKTKAALLRQIKTNAAYVRDMRVKGRVLFESYADDGVCKAIRYDGSKFRVTQISVTA